MKYAPSVGSDIWSVREELNLQNLVSKTSTYAWFRHAPISAPLSGLPTKPGFKHLGYIKLSGYSPRIGQNKRLEIFFFSIHLKPPKIKLTLFNLRCQKTGESCLHQINHSYNWFLHIYYSITIFSVSSMAPRTANWNSLVLSLIPNSLQRVTHQFQAQW